MAAVKSIGTRHSLSQPYPTIKLKSKKLKPDNPISDPDRSDEIVVPRNARGLWVLKGIFCLGFASFHNLFRHQASLYAPLASDKV